MKIPFSPMVTSFFLLFDFSRLRLVHYLKRRKRRAEERKREGEKQKRTNEKRKSVLSPVNTCHIPSYNWSSPTYTYINIISFDILFLKEKHEYVGC